MTSILKKIHLGIDGKREKYTNQMSVNITHLITNTFVQAHYIQSDNIHQE